MSSIALYTTRLAFVVFLWILIFVGGSDGKVSACDEGDLGFIPESRRSPGEGNGNPLQYYCLENPMDRGAWQATGPRGHERVRYGLASKQQKQK